MRFPSTEPSRAGERVSCVPRVSNSPDLRDAERARRASSSTASSSVSSSSSYSLSFAPAYVACASLAVLSSASTCACAAFKSSSSSRIRLFFSFSKRETRVARSERDAARASANFSSSKRASVSADRDAATSRSSERQTERSVSLRRTDSPYNATTIAYDSGDDDIIASVFVSLTRSSSAVPTSLRSDADADAVGAGGFAVASSFHVSRVAPCGASCHVHRSTALGGGARSASAGSAARRNAPTPPGSALPGAPALVFVFVFGANSNRKWSPASSDANAPTARSYQLSNRTFEGWRQFSARHTVGGCAPVPGATSVTSNERSS